VQLSAHFAAQGSTMASLVLNRALLACRGPITARLVHLCVLGRRAFLDYTDLLGRQVPWLLSAHCVQPEAIRSL
jgi:hypothetical protein